MFGKDLIGAIASAPGAGGGGILRVSGRGGWDVIVPAFFCADALAEDSFDSARRYAGKWKLGESFDHEMIDVAVYFWPGERSYTGEPMLEIHAPGSGVLLNEISRQIFSKGVRTANRGEFTLRAFLAGKIDLVQAEGVLGVIDARDGAELQSALTQLAGGISREFEVVRSDLLNLLADLEAGLDFTDEGLTFVSRSDVLQRLNSGIEFLGKMLRNADDRMWDRALPKVLLAGPTNAGKSTLFNSLVGEPAAIVSPESGTTRDLNSRVVTWEGLRVELVDTAGEEGVPSELVQFGLQLRDQEVARGAFVVWCVPSDNQMGENNDWRVRDGFDTGHLILVETKSDLAGEKRVIEEEVSRDKFRVSALTGEGLEELKQEIVRMVGYCSKGERLVGMTAVRCRRSLESGIESLQRAWGVVDQEEGDEFASQEVREALQAIGEVTGEVHTNDLLDRIFSRFCIGK